MLTCHPELISVPKRFVEIRLVVEITRDMQGNIVYTPFGEVVSGRKLIKI